MRDIIEGLGWYPPVVLGDSHIYDISLLPTSNVYILAYTPLSSISGLCSAVAIISLALLVILLACHCELLSGPCVQLPMILIMIRPFWPLIYDQCVVEKLMFHFCS